MTTPSLAELARYNGILAGKRDFDQQKRIKAAYLLQAGHSTFDQNIVTGTYRQKRAYARTWMYHYLLGWQQAVDEAESQHLAKYDPWRVGGTCSKVLVQVLADAPRKLCTRASVVETHFGPLCTTCYEAWKLNLQVMAEQMKTIKDNATAGAKRTLGPNPAFPTGSYSGGYTDVDDMALVRRRTQSMHKHGESVPTIAKALGISEADVMDNIWGDHAATPRQTLREAAQCRYDETCANIAAINSDDGPMCPQHYKAYLLGSSGAENR